MPQPVYRFPPASHSHSHTYSGMAPHPHPSLGFGMSQPINLSGPVQMMPMGVNLGLNMGINMGHHNGSAHHIHYQSPVHSHPAAMQSFVSPALALQHLPMGVVSPAALALPAVSVSRSASVRRSVGVPVSSSEFHRPSKRIRKSSGAGSGDESSSDSDNANASLLASGLVMSSLSPGQLPGHRRRHQSSFSPLSRFFDRSGSAVRLYLPKEIIRFEVPLSLQSHGFTTKRIKVIDKFIPSYASEPHIAVEVRSMKRVNDTANDTFLVAIDLCCLLGIRRSNTAIFMRVYSEDEVLKVLPESSVWQKGSSGGGNANRPPVPVSSGAESKAVTDPIEEWCSALVLLTNAGLVRMLSNSRRAMGKAMRSEFIRLGLVHETASATEKAKDDNAGPSTDDKVSASDLHPSGLPVRCFRLYWSHETAAIRMEQTIYKEPQSFVP
jgi:hypothetical protein